MTACPERHAQLDSEQLARNAAELHTWANPWCTAFRAFPCGDHWHVGHPTKAAGDECKRQQPSERPTQRAHREARRARGRPRST